ncbi:zinc knuckle family protein [Hordeum vulgare]|nr:zinc knuckle family protein [Hordeum vulgare]
MSSATTYSESIASCRPPTPICSPSLAATAAAVPDAAPLPVRRQLDFPSGEGNTDDDDDFFFLVAEEMERNLDQVARRAAQSLTPPTLAMARPTFRVKQCICRRGPCDVEWKEGGWAYVCSATPVSLPLPCFFFFENMPPSQPKVIFWLQFLLLFCGIRMVYWTSLTSFCMVFPTLLGFLGRENCNVGRKAQ